MFVYLVLFLAAGILLSVYQRHWSAENASTADIHQSADRATRSLLLDMWKEPPKGPIPAVLNPLPRRHHQHHHHPKPPKEIDTSEYNYIPLKKRLEPLPPDQPNNAITYVYIAGVEGVGHHGITPAIASIARTCNEYVAYQDPILKEAHIQRNSTRFQHYLDYLRRRNLVNHTRITFVEDASFPTDDKLRNSTMEQKKLYGAYDLEWTLDELLRFRDGYHPNRTSADADAGVGADASGSEGIVTGATTTTSAAPVTIRYLYLNRDFYRTVRSHPEFDLTFERHAQVLYDFVHYIDSEYRRIDAKQPGLWRQIMYEWFIEPDSPAGTTAGATAGNASPGFSQSRLPGTHQPSQRYRHSCPELVAAIIQFVGWNDCDVAFACEVLNTTLTKPRTHREVNGTEIAYAGQFDVALAIPTLKIRALERTATTTTSTTTTTSLSVADPGTPTDHSAADTYLYPFRTRVSDRVPFSYATNVSHRAQARKVMLQAWKAELARRRAVLGNHTHSNHTHRAGGYGGDHQGGLRQMPLPRPPRSVNHTHAVKNTFTEPFSAISYWKDRLTTGKGKGKGKKGLTQAAADQGNRTVIVGTSSSGINIGGVHNGSVGEGGSGGTPPTLRGSARNH